MIEACNKVLYFICAACVVLTATVVLIAILGKINNDMIWQIVGSGFVVFMAAGSMHAINSHVLKMRMENKKTERTEPPA